LDDERAEQPEADLLGRIVMRMVHVRSRIRHDELVGERLAWLHRRASSAWPACDCCAAAAFDSALHAAPIATANNPPSRRNPRRELRFSSRSVTIESDIVIAPTLLREIYGSRRSGCVGRVPNSRRGIPVIRSGIPLCSGRRYRGLSRGYFCSSAEAIAFAPMLSSKLTFTSSPVLRRPNNAVGGLMP